jgi:hypothetical protein
VLSRSYGEGVLTGSTARTSASAARARLANALIPAFAKPGNG